MYWYSKTMPIWVAVIALFFIATGAITGTVAFASATDTFIEAVVQEQAIANTQTCVGVGRFELGSSVVFDTCTGRTYWWNTEAQTWEIAIPAIPDVPRTQAELANWDALRR